METFTLQGDILEKIGELKTNFFDLVFFDPPFRQGKEYRFFDDNMEMDEYWQWISLCLHDITAVTQEGGAIYFMQREKNVQKVIWLLEYFNWTIQNIIIWKKMTSAVPQPFRFGKHYQVIVYATKGSRPKTFHRLRIDKPLLAHQKIARKDGLYITDVWDDIREMTSGYFSGKEAYRKGDGKRFHKQQSPIQLLLRIILTSTKPQHKILDPMMGTGTTLRVANQLNRESVGIEIDPLYFKKVEKRLDTLREYDNIDQYKEYYRFTPDLDAIWR